MHDGCPGKFKRSGIISVMSRDNVTNFLENFIATQMVGGNRA